MVLQPLRFLSKSFDMIFWYVLIYIQFYISYLLLSIELLILVIYSGSHLYQHWEGNLRRQEWAGLCVHQVRQECWHVCEPGQTRYTTLEQNNNFYFNFEDIQATIYIIANRWVTLLVFPEAEFWLIFYTVYSVKYYLKLGLWAIVWGKWHIYYRNS